MPSIIYDSDTEQEEEEEKINPPPSQLDPLIELGDNLDLQSAHLSLSRSDRNAISSDSADLKDGLPAVIRRSSRQRELSGKALENIASLVATFSSHDVIKVFATECTLDGNQGNPSPFAHLFDPKTMTRWDDPKGFSAAMKHKMAKYFIEAMLKERNAWFARGVVSLVRKKDIPSSCITYRSVDVFKTKWNEQTGHVEKFKYRLCLQGSKSKFAMSKEVTFEPCVSMTTIKVLFDMVVRFGLVWARTDIKEFYLNCEKEEGKRYFMEIPKGWSTEDPRDFAFELHKMVYGLPEASKTSGAKLKQRMIHQRLQPGVHDPRLYVKWISDEDVVLTAVHSDDMLWFSTTMGHIRAEVAELQKIFDIPSIEEYATSYRGFQIRCNDKEDKTRSITLHQAGFIEKSIRKAPWADELHRLPDVPCPANAVSENAKIEPVAQSDKLTRQYMRLQGDLQYIAPMYPTLNWTVNWLSRFMQNPQDTHFKIQKQCHLYAYKIRNEGITFRRQGDPDKLRKGYEFDDVEFYSDATFADDHTDSKSTTGYLVMTKTGCIDHYTGKQNHVTTSTCQSEIVSNKSCTQKGIWIKGVYVDMSFMFTRPSNTWQDNQGSIALCRSEAHHSRSRHFRVACHFLRELYERRQFIWCWIESNRMLADILTKPLPRDQHNNLGKAITNSNQT
jgi:hypothetical protein